MIQLSTGIKSTLCILGACMALVPALPVNAVAQADKSDAKRGQIILRNLPPRGSAAYNELLGLAGKDARGQILRLSQTEMWSMPAARVDEVVQQGSRLGVKVTPLGERWNHILQAPPSMPAMSKKQEDMMADMKSAPEVMSMQMIAAPSDPAVVEYALMKDHEGDAIGPPPPKGLPVDIVIPLGDTNLSIRRTSIDMRANGCTWRGVIAETGEPVMLMWWKDGRFSGMFTYRGRQYTVKSMGGAIHAVVESDARKLPPDHGAMPLSKIGADLKDDPLVSRGEGDMLRAPSLRNPTGPGLGREEGLAERRDGGEQAGVRPIPKAAVKKPAVTPLSMQQRRALAQRGATIDMMILYTPKVAAKYVDVDADLIQLAIEQTNVSFTNSGVGNVKVRLVHSEMTAYDEADGEHFDHLYRMVDGIGSFSKTRKLRNEKKADVVILVVDDASGCGLSTRVAAEADEAFAVVHHACAALSYSVAHELGHIIGARHERAIDANETPFPFAHGYVSGKRWRDIMSYKQSCDGCPRQPFWSNPTMKFLGDPGGKPDTDNARVILEQAGRVARFR